MDVTQEVDGFEQEVGLERAMSATTCDVFNELRLGGQLCDAVIEAEGRRFNAHKNILCGCSPYFRALFTSAGAPPRPAGVYPIPGVAADTMQLLLEYAYTRRLAVSADTVEALLVAADYLSVPGAVRACCRYLGARLSVANVVGVWRLTAHYPLPRLRRQAYGFLLRCFEEVARASEEFPELAPGELERLLGEDGLNAAREEAVFEALLRWVSHDEEGRRGHLAQLLLKVRMGLMDPEYFLSRVESHPLVRRDTRCSPAVTAMLRLIGACDASARLDVLNPLTRPRLPPAVLLAVGGWSGGAPTGSVESYDARADRWVGVPVEGEEPRAYHGVVVLGDALYCVGGFDGVQYFNSVRRFDLAACRWRPAAPMHARRCYVSVAALDGCVYAMGGYDGHERLSSLERYRPHGNQWTPLAAMSEARSDASATTLHGKVYICGGFNGSVCLDSAECYDPRADQWTLLPPMGGPRSGVGVMAYRDQVYALGGFDGVDRLLSVEAFSPGAAAWRAAPAMLGPRSNFGVEVLEGRLYVAGGFNGHSTSFSAERYDGATGAWSAVRDMAVHRSALSCCVVTGLADLAEYAFPRPPPAPPALPDQDFD
ncbi:kelch-like protein 10 [Gadus macrocephalus]|uniref:kelch-like protein 10 n=1 Tax=Gadus macrocephalus TaxID=80720 RepID=UPI0028CB18ED|nr:kelch-like protein 10 [Gadus macrocephalus]